MIDIKKLIYQCCSNGSTWVLRETLEEYLSQYGGRIDDVESIVGKGVAREKDIKGNILYTTSEIALMEHEIAENIMRILYKSPPWKVDDSIIEGFVHEFEETQNNGRKLHYHQVDAVKMVVTYNFSVLTGGPGTGKTTVLSAITYVLRRVQETISIVFTAPTGKAAKRITESTGEHATTLHKKLGVGYAGVKNDRFYEDVLFIDESSMNDTFLTDVLCKAVSTGKKVVFVGDIDQLPSVGIGAVLRDLIASRTVPTTMLTHTFRQDNSSVLYQNICNIREGIAKVVKGNDFIPVELKDGDVSQECIKDICKLYQNAVKEYGVENVAVLLPYRKRGVCSNKLNNYLQNIVNGENKMAYRYTNAKEENVLFFKENDFVMQLKNRAICANGDIGKVIEVSANGIQVEYTDGIVNYKPNELDELALAYAMSIHKSQGSEYQCVIMALLDDHSAMLNRNLLYTGVTRAKKKCILIYQKSAYETAISRKADTERITCLVKFLQSARAKYRTLYGI